jgi:hypothetical protein
MNIVKPGRLTELGGAMFMLKIIRDMGLVDGYQHLGEVFGYLRAEVMFCLLGLYLRWK